MTTTREPEPGCQTDGPPSTEETPERIRTLATEVQLVLAEKRTSLSMLRTGIAVSAVPLSITTVLVALSKFYDWAANLHFLIPMFVLMGALVCLAAYLIVRSIRRIHHYDRMIAKLRDKEKVLDELIE